MVMRTSSVAAFLLLVALRPCWASDGRSDRATLKGVPAMNVVIEDLSPGVEHNWPYEVTTPERRRVAASPVRHPRRRHCAGIPICGSDLASERWSHISVGGPDLFT